ncbi:MAG TPA: right-handed parallel beta-helix repeat-containing protein [Planctomycetota bacterium]|nr:right-handed parallel beta-helix repeat-containing protein [Planctomycetota bacterium]
MFRDNLVTGNRNGVNLQFMNGATLRNNVVTDNRTGMQMVDGVTNTLVTQNDFTNNWTIGVLFRDEGPGSDTTGTTFVDNRIEGNWYGQIEYRLGGATSTAKNFSGNFLGTTTPTIVATNGGEPGYAAQIPVAFGGSATPPGGQPDVKGDGSSFFDVTPLLASGVDTDVDGGFGAAGFQGDFSTVAVVTVLAQVGASGRVTEGAAMVAVGGTVNVAAGVYVENATIAKRCTVAGAGSGGAGPATPGDTVVQAASAAQSAITLAAGGLDATNRLVIRDLRTTGATGADGVRTAVTPCSYLTLERVTSIGNGNGVHFAAAAGVVDDVLIDDCVLTQSGGAGLRVASATSSIVGLDVVGGAITSNNTHGFAFNESLSATCVGDALSFDGTTFSDNGSIIAGNGTGHLSFFGFHGSSTLKDLTLSGTAFVPVQYRGLGPAGTPGVWQPLGPTTFQNVVVSGATPRPAVYMQLYSDLSATSFSGLDLSGMSSTNAPGGFFSNGGMALTHVGPNVQLGDTIFPCQGAGYFGLAMGQSGGADASCATVFSGATTLAQKEACVLDGGDAPGLGDVTFQDVTFPGPPVGGTTCEGQPFVFTVTPGGLGTFTYQWRKDGSDLPGETGAALSFAAVAPGDAGSYDVVVTGACGPETSPAAVLAVTPLPVAPSSASASPDVVCDGVAGTVTLTATGGAGATLEWFEGACGGTPIGTGNGLVVAAPLAATTYYVRWSDVCGVSACASTTVSIQPNPTASAGGPYVGCHLAGVAVSGSATDASSTLWTSSGTGAFVDPTSAATTYLPSAADVTAGSVTLTFTAFATAPCATPATSNATLTIGGSPATVYVDDDYAPLAPGATTAFPFGGGGPLRTVGCDAFATIQGAVNAAPNGATIHVAAGTYSEDVAVFKPCTLLGAGPGASVVIGPIGGPGAGVHFQSNGVTLDGFTVTRAGNNPADWNNPGLNSAGVAIQGLSSGTVRNCLLTGNRTGIDINNSSGIVVRNCVVDDNRTGMILRNRTDDLVVTENSVSNNWTAGILFLDASGGTNSPLQQALNSASTRNAIAGNWYGQIVDRQVGGSLPTPGTTHLKNFSSNWLGTASPVISTANSAEPGYAAQIPVAFGGTATPPGGQPDVLGPASANFDVTPWLNSGVDVDVSTGFGVYGFQGDFGALTVTDELAQTGAAGRVTEGAAEVSEGGLVKVTAGLFVENATIVRRCVVDGAGSGDAGAANAAIHTIIQAASSSQPAITLAAGGLDQANRLILSDLRTTGATGSDGVATGVSPCSHLGFERVTSVGNVNGLHFGVASGVVDDVVAEECVFSQNANAGVRVASATAFFTGLDVVDGEMTGNGFMGFSFNPAGLTSCFGDDLDFIGTTFADNGAPGLSGTGHLSFFVFNGSAELRNLTMTGSTRVPAQFRGAGDPGTPGTWSPLGSVTFDDVVVSGACTRPGVYLQVYSDVTGVSFTDLDLTGMTSLNAPFSGFAVNGMAVEHLGANLDLGDTKFACQGAGYVALAMFGPGGANASCATVFNGATTLTDKETCVLDAGDLGALGDVTFPDAEITVPPSGGTICEGAPFSFTVTTIGVGPFGYQWRKDGSDLPGETGPSLSIAAATPGDAGSYDVVVTGGCGPITSAAAVLGVTPSPVAPASASSSPPSVCFGVGGTITLSASGGSGAVLEWFDDVCGGNLVGTGDGLVLPAPAASTTYFARWSTPPCGATACASVTVSVQQPPTAAAGGPYVTCDQNGVAVFGVATDAASTTWSSSGSGAFADPSSPATTYMPSAADVAAGSVTLTFSAAATAPCLVAAFDAALLTVNASPTVTAPASEVACQGGTVIFSTTSTGTGVTLQWRKDGSDLFGETGATLTLTGVTDADEGAYDVVATGTCGTATSAPGYLTVLAPAFDDPCVAWDVGLGGAFAGDTTCASPQAVLLPTGCGAATALSNDVWYVFNARCDGVVTASTCPFTGGGLATFDTHLSVFEGTPQGSLGCPWNVGSGTFTQVACNDGAPGCFLFSTTTFPVVKGSTYYLRLAGSTAADKGAYVLDVDFDAALTLSITQPSGPGSVEVANTLCEPGYLYYTALTVDPTNAFAFGQGWFFGLHISMPEIVTQFTWPGGVPFVGLLDGSGGSVWSLSGLGPLGGFHVYGVTVTFDPSQNLALSCTSNLVDSGPLF